MRIRRPTVRRKPLFLQLERLDERITPAVTPTQIQHAYGFDLVTPANGVTLDGTGQTIAIIDAYYDSHALSDLTTFSSQYGLPAPVSGTNFLQVGQTGGSPNGYTQNSGWANETALDIEWAHAIAPGATILLVEGQTSSSNNLNAAVDYARGLTGVTTVSMSWGSGEFTSETSTTNNNHYTTPTGHAGVSFFASSGDTGGQVIYPSASPNVVSVGGTSLTLSSDGTGTYVSESAWSGGGGGPSAYVTKPSWQTAYTGTMRGTPDVSYDSDPNTGFSVYNNGWEQVGGTSDAAPQWAAIVSLVNQGRAAWGLSSLDGPGQLLPALYQLPATDFHDITTGSNGYSATSGYDLATGRGTPKAQLVIHDLIAYGTTAPAVTTQPTSQSVTAGQSVTFTAAASGSPAPVVQWQISTDGGNTWTNITGATGTTYTYTPAAGDNGDQFRAVFTNPAASVNTTTATLTVTSSTPVSIAGIQVNDGSAQRSEVRSITVTFSGAVNFAGGNANAAAAFQLLHVQTGDAVILSAAVGTNGAGQTVVTLTFLPTTVNGVNDTDAVSASNGGQLSLADGRYQLTVLASAVTGTNGVGLAGNGLTAGTNYVTPTETSYSPTALHLYRLFGDATGDGVVDLSDLTAFRNTYNAGTGNPAYLSFLDADNSGVVDLSDLTQFRNRYNASVY
jgi:subtilase family serine protease